MSWLTSFLGRGAAPRGGNVQQALEDTEWSDISSEDNSKLDDIYPDIDPEELLPYMPSLFTNDPPPCGPIPQVAYENVLKRMRTLWLQHAKEHPGNIHIVAICTLVKDDLDAEAAKSPPDSELCTGRRRPWRRESVFSYEIRWAKYFVREATAQEKLLTMNETELDRRNFMDRLFPIPKELHIYTKNNGDRDGILGLWRAWHQKKRPAPQVVENAGFEAGLAGGHEDGLEATDSVNGLTTSINNSVTNVEHEEVTQSKTRQEQADTQETSQSGQV